MEFFCTSKMDQARQALLTAQAHYRAHSTPHEWQKFNEALRMYRQALKEEEIGHEKNKRIDQEYMDNIISL